MLRRALVLLASVAGCGSGPSVVDLGLNDLTGGGDGGPDMSFVVTGTRLASGNLSMVGVTSDDWAIYHDDDMRSVHAVRVNGGPTVRIADDVCTAGLQGKVVYAWFACDNNDNGRLVVWSNGAGNEVTQRSPGDLGAVSPDGTSIVYFANAVGSSADLVLDKVDGSAPKTIVAGVAVRSLSCRPIVDFVGPRVVASFCVMTTLPTIASFDAAGARADLLRDAANFWVADRAGTKVLVKSGTDSGSVFPIGGGAPLASGIADLGEAAFTPDGAAIVYSTTKGTLNRIPATGGAPTVLQMGIGYMNALSPDGNHVIYNTITSMSGYTDLALASAAAPGKATTLSATPTAATGSFFGDPFSADSSHALWFGNVDESTTAGSLAAVPTAGGNVKGIGSGATVVLAAEGSRVVFSDSFTPVANQIGRGDLKVVDLAAAGPAPTLIANQADLLFNLTADKKTVVYSFSAGGGNSPGVYAARFQ